MKSSRLVRILSVLLLAAPFARADQEILNASFDIGRELFADVNQAFVPYWKQKTGETVVVRQSHAGSSKQVFAIREGLQADVVTFNQVSDVQALADAKLVAKDWPSKFPYHSSPFYSVQAILVRKGNPKGIHGWADLAKPGVSIVQTNPKTSGNGRYAILAYYAYALQANGGDQAKAREFLKKVLANVVVFETGGRGATSTFTQRGIGDVLVTFEAETLAYAAGGDYQAITPDVSILSEFPVAVVDKVAKRQGAEALAKGYLDFLYTPAAQEVIAKNFYRPRDEEVAARHASQLRPVKALSVESVFGGWSNVTGEFFANGALVDTLLKEIAAER